MARRTVSSELDTPIWIPNPEQTRLLIWDITPQAKRQPATLGGLAKELGVDPGTLSRWQKLPQWIEYRNLFIFLKLKSRLPNIVNAYIEDLEGDSTQSWQARRDFFRYGLPMLTQTVNDPRLRAIEQATNNLLPAKSLQQVVDALPPDHQESVVKALEDLGIVEPEYPQDPAASAHAGQNDLNFSQYENTTVDRPRPGDSIDSSDVIVQQPKNRPAPRLKTGTGSKGRSPLRPQKGR